ncbi:MAG: sialidase, partial [Deltaproteobacteria bacterium]|nr:sialidase [Deltaproteobacteria bacterium]
VFYIAGEAGLLFRSDNNGRSWQELPSPYEGSFFGILPLPDDTLLAYGLRGHVFRSADGGRHWQPVPTGTKALLTDAARLPDGTIIITGMSGTILTSTDGGQTFSLRQPNRVSLTAVLIAAGDTVVLGGERGLKRCPLTDFSQ